MAFVDEVLAVLDHMDDHAPQVLPILVSVNPFHWADIVCEACNYADRASDVVSYRLHRKRGEVEVCPDPAVPYGSIEVTAEGLSKSDQ